MPSRGRHVSALLHATTRRDPIAGVPLLGIAAAVSTGVIGQAWVPVSIALTAAAAIVLVARILPGQRAALKGNPVTRLAVTT